MLTTSVSVVPCTYLHCLCVRILFWTDNLVIPWVFLSSDDFDLKLYCISEDKEQIKILLGGGFIQNWRETEASLSFDELPTSYQVLPTFFVFPYKNPYKLVTISEIMHVILHQRIVNKHCIFYHVQKCSHLSILRTWILLVIIIASCLIKQEDNFI